MEPSEPFNIKPLFDHIEDDIIKEMSLSIQHLRYVLENEKSVNKALLTENYKLKNELKITATKLKKYKLH